MDALALAKSLYERRRFDDACETLLPYLETASDNNRLDALLLLANAYDEAGKSAHALQALQQLLAADPENAQAWNNTGIVCQKIERYDEAKEAFERAYRLDPAKAEYLINLSALHLRLSDPGTALEYIQLAIQLHPSHPLAHANLSLTLAVFGRLEEAEESLRVAALYGFDNPEPIQERINKLKGIRDAIIERAGEQPPAPDTVTEDEQEARNRLANKERLIRALVKRQHDRIYESDTDSLQDEELDGQIAALRMEIRELRKAFDLPEVAADDMFMGENYMVLPEEEGEEDGE